MHVDSQWKTLDEIARMQGVALQTVRNSYRELLGDWACRREGARVFVHGPLYFSTVVDRALRAKTLTVDLGQESGEELGWRALRKLADQPGGAELARKALESLSPFPTTAEGRAGG